MIRARMLGICAAVLVGVAVLPPHLASAQIDSAASEKEEYGAQLDAEGWVHFGIHSPEADQVDLLLFDAPDATAPAQVIPLQRHGGDWRVKIRGPEIGPGSAYTTTPPMRFPVT